MDAPRREGNRVPFVRVLRPPANGQIQFVVLSEHLESWTTHWVEGRERPCMLEFSRPCAHCAAGRRSQHSWYCLAMEWPTRQICIGHITDGAMRHCAELEDGRQNARGLGLTLIRGGKGCSGVKAVVGKKRVPADQMVTTNLDLRTVLCRLWGITPAGMPAESEVDISPAGSGSAEDPASPFADQADSPAAPNYATPAEDEPEDMKSGDERWKALFQQFLDRTKDRNGEA